jgi:energy-coupling factor transport system ATP-binding protein
MTGAESARRPPRLVTHGLGFVYPDGTRALASVDLAIEPGQRVAIIGQNGSGKSTLVRHFNGLLRATEGHLTLDGQAITGRHVADLARVVGIGFQNPDRQIFAGSVRAEVGFGPRNMGLGGERLDAVVAEALAAVGLVGFEEANPYDLGYSRRKLLTIASVLAVQTPVVVLDEPTTGQDLAGVQTIERVVAGLAAAGRTVIAISHDMRFVAESFERVVVMRQGTIALDGSPAAVFGEEAWPTLRSTNLEPPYAAQLGAQLGLGSTPTEASLVAALAARTDRG